MGELLCEWREVEGRQIQKESEERWEKRKESKGRRTENEVEDGWGKNDQYLYDFWPGIYPGFFIGTFFQSSACFSLLRKDVVEDACLVVVVCNMAPWTLPCSITRHLQPPTIEDSPYLLTCTSTVTR